MSDPEDRPPASEPQPRRSSLHVNEEHFRLLVESVRDYAIFILDAEGYVATWNDGAQRIKGYLSGEIIGRHFSRFYPIEEVRSGKCELELRLAGSEGRFEDEGWRKRKDGTLFWANVIITALRDDQGQLIGFAKVTRDLTERRKSEEERIRLAAEQQARAAADAANRAKDGFLAHISHELRTPLNAILGWAKLLERGGLDDTRRSRGTQALVRNAEAMTSLIDDLLDVARIISGKMRLDLEPVDFSLVVERALDSVRLQAESKGVALCQTLGAVGMVKGDASRLQQVVWNLLTNAIKFTPKGGSVEIALQQVGANVELTVRDTGIGITADKLELVFESFWQERRAQGPGGVGLGLGLSICRNLVELHEGHIFATSTGPDRGACFTVHLPTSVLGATHIIDAGADRSGVRTSLPQLNGVHVLLVEDDSDARDLVRTILEDGGARVTEAGDVAGAMAAFEREVPDLLLSDIGLPDESGYELIRRIRALPSDDGGRVPAAAMTAYARVDDRLHALSAGFTVHVPKPVQPQELVMIVAALATHVRERRAGA